MNKELGTWGKVKKAFAILRKQGVEARMNFMCCSTCACSAMDDKRALKVYFHTQDTERWMQSDRLAIRYCVYEDIKDSRVSGVDKTVKAHAKHIKEVLEGVGLRVEWSGKTDEILEVIG